MRVELWSDGSGTANGPGGWAYVLVAVSEQGELLSKKEGSGSYPVTTNNRMELQAVAEGLAALTRPTPVTVMTDSEYVAYGFSRGWVAGWQTRGWRTSGRANGVDWEAMRSQCPVCGNVSALAVDVCVRHEATQMVAPVDPKMVRNKDVWMALDFLVGFHKGTRFVTVAGHAGVELNERADELAGAERRRLIDGLAGAISHAPPISPPP